MRSSPSDMVTNIKKSKKKCPGKRGYRDPYWRMWKNLHCGKFVKNNWKDFDFSSVSFAMLTVQSDIFSYHHKMGKTTFQEHEGNRKLFSWTTYCHSAFICMAVLFTSSSMLQSFLSDGGDHWTLIIPFIQWWVICLNWYSQLWRNRPCRANPTH